MKIEIDLKEILTDEFGNSENLASTIKSEIVSSLSNTLSKGIEKRINDEVSKLLDEEIKRVVSCQMPSLLSELIDKEYGDTYGYTPLWISSLITPPSKFGLLTKIPIDPATEPNF